MTEKTKLNIGKILIISLIPMALEMMWAIYNGFFPLILQGGNPDIAKAVGTIGFGLSPTITGTLMTLDNTIILFAAPAVAILSDYSKSKHGRRKPILVVGGVAIAIAFIIIPFIIDSIPAELSGNTGALTMRLVFMILCMSTIIIGVALTKVTSKALLWDTVPNDKRSMAQGITTFAAGIMSIVATFMMGALYKSNKLLAFGIVSLFLIAGVIVLVFRIKEKQVTHEELQSDKKPNPFKLIFAGITKLTPQRKKGLLLAFLTVVLIAIPISLVQAFTSSYAVYSLGVSEKGAATYLIIFGLALIAMSLPAGALAQKIGRKKAVIIGIIACIISSALAYFIKSAQAFYFLVGLIGASWSIININVGLLIIDANQDEAKLGFFSSLRQVAFSLGFIIGPIVGGALVQAFNNDYSLLWGMMPVGFILALIPLIMLRYEEKEKPAA